MANYIATDTDLTAVADAIRAKGGMSTSLAFPTGFVDAIDAIETGGGGSGLKYEVGDFTIAEDTNATTPVGITHGLGVTPACVIIWQSTYTDENIPTVQVNAGYVFLNRIMDIKQRASSSSSIQNSFYAYFSIGANTTVGSAFNSPSSSSYALSQGDLPTSEKFFLNKIGGSNYWRAGVQYHYFVSEAWW